MEHAWRLGWVGQLQSYLLVVHVVQFDLIQLFNQRVVVEAQVTVNRCWLVLGVVHSHLGLVRVYVRGEENEVFLDAEFIFVLDAELLGKLRVVIIQIRLVGNFLFVGLFDFLMFVCAVIVFFSNIILFSLLPCLELFLCLRIDTRVTFCRKLLQR